MDKHTQETFTYPPKAGQCCIRGEEEEELRLPDPYLIPYKTKRGSKLPTTYHTQWELNKLTLQPEGQGRETTTEPGSLCSLPDSTTWGAKGVFYLEMRKERQSC